MIFRKVHIHHALAENVTMLPRLLSLPMVALALIAAVPAPSNDADIHFGLTRSVPEAGASVASPSAVQLWFTEEPAEGTIAIRLVEAEDADVHVGEAIQDADDPRAFAVALHGALAPGVYTVSWRGMGSDGHVVRDTFQFTVAAR